MRLRLSWLIPSLLCVATALPLLMTLPTPAAVSSYDEARTYVHPRDFDFDTLLGNPPAVDSAEHAAEITTLLAWQNRRTTEQINRARREAREIDVWLFSDVLGDGFNAKTHPLTAALFNEVRANTEPVIHAAKRHWNRPRPAVEDPRISPCVPRESSAAYPSGHATNAMVNGLILAAIFPEDHDALIARGKLVGEDRVVAGIHWPSDVVAGQKLGSEIARRLLDDHDFQYELQRASEECHGGSAAAGNQPASRPAATQPVGSMP